MRFGTHKCFVFGGFLVPSLVCRRKGHSRRAHRSLCLKTNLPETYDINIGFEIYNRSLVPLRC